MCSLCLLKETSKKHKYLQRKDFLVRADCGMYEEKDSFSWMSWSPRVSSARQCNLLLLAESKESLFKGRIVEGEALQRR